MFIAIPLGSWSRCPQAVDGTERLSNSPKITQKENPGPGFKSKQLGSKPMLCTYTFWDACTLTGIREGEGETEDIELEKCCCSNEEWCKERFKAQLGCLSWRGWTLVLWNTRERGTMSRKGQGETRAVEGSPERQFRQSHSWKSWQEGGSGAVLVRCS